MEHKPNDLERQIAVLEERMNTKQAEYKTDIAQLAAKNDLLRAYISDWKAESATKQSEYKSDIARHAAEMSDWKTEAAKRETRLVMVMVALVSVAVAILKFT